MVTDRRIAGAFNREFSVSHGTVLVGGGAEPLYVPDVRLPGGSRRAVIRYRHDYAASALHEAAHWCLASGAARRLVDFGCVYDPPPRDANRQRAFFEAEAAVQVLERALASAAGRCFQVSADDPHAAPRLVEEFDRRVRATAVEPLLTAEARRLIEALRRLRGSR